MEFVRKRKADKQTMPPPAAKRARTLTAPQQVTVQINHEPEEMDPAMQQKRVMSFIRQLEQNVKSSRDDETTAFSSLAAGPGNETDEKKSFIDPVVDSATSNATDQTPSSATNRQKKNDGKCKLIRIPEGEFGTDLCHADQNVVLTEYADDVLSYVMDTLNHGSCRILKLDGDMKNHLRFMKRWIIQYYGTYCLTGAKGLSLGALMWYARTWLFALSDSEHVDHSSMQESVPSLLHQLNQLCLNPNQQSRGELVQHLQQIDYTVTKHVINAVASGSRIQTDIIESLSRLYAYCQLQLYYLVKLELQPRSLVMQDQLLAACQKECIVERQTFLAYQVSEGFQNKYNEFVYQHWLTSGLTELYARQHSGIGKRTQLVVMINGVLSHAEHQRVKAMINVDIKKTMSAFQYGHQPIRSDGKDAKQTAGSTSAMATVERCGKIVLDLVDLLIMAYMFEQKHREDWLSRYYLPQNQFFKKHATLVTATRWQRERRPVICMLLGRWCVVRHNGEFFFADSGFDAFVLWVYLVRKFYNSKLESGKLI